MNIRRFDQENLYTTNKSTNPYHTSIQQSPCLIHLPIPSSESHRLTLQTPFFIHEKLIYFRHLLRSAMPLPAALSRGALTANAVPIANRSIDEYPTGAVEGREEPPNAACICVELFLAKFAAAGLLRAEEVSLQCSMPRVP
mmetsp:Transcript_99322/g.160140  ORF Transcript_99322/g.160140 Transcript_99322/m.160140 type:complete len:141 (-) Transcript_99322:595-1017(-)